ncbi:MAG TPA: DUF2157 domain-containing protein [Acidimicrobiales bacterium]|nr:DUF2157 domain-containing protein [Acidimicrobiales bacterium]
MVLGLVGVLVIVAVAGLLLSRRPRNALTPPETPVPGSSVARPTPRATAGVIGELDRWVQAGLLTPEQSSAIATFEATRAPARVARAKRFGSSRVPATAEALGYLGGILAVVGLSLLVARSWSSISTAGKLALSGASALGLLLGGGMVRGSDPAFARLRGFLWLASSAAAGLFAGDFVYDGLGITKSASIVLAAAGLITIQNVLLWLGRHRAIQQLTALVGLAVTLGAAVAETASESWVGATIWLVGFAYVAIGLRRLTTYSLLNEATGAVALVTGSVIMTSNWEAFGFTVAPLTGLALLALALVPGLVGHAEDRRLFLITGIAAMLMTVPGTIGYFARDGGLITGFAVWLFGGVCLFLGARKLIFDAPLGEIAGGVFMVVGAAITSVQFEAVGPIFGLVNALVLVGLGTIPGQVVLSFLGSVGLLVNVPWFILHFFPGEGRAPLLILISGALIVAIALALAHERGRFRSELGVFFHRH